MGRVAEGLVFRQAARTVVVVLGSEERLLHYVWANFWRDRKWLLLRVETSLECTALELLDGHSLMADEIWVQMLHIEVRISLLDCLSLFLILAKEIIWASPV